MEGEEPLSVEMLWMWEVGLLDRKSFSQGMRSRRSHKGTSSSPSKTGLGGIPWSPWLTFSGFFMFPYERLTVEGPEASISWGKGSLLPHNTTEILDTHTLASLGSHLPVTPRKAMGILQGKVSMHSFLHIYIWCQERAPHSREFLDPGRLLPAETVGLWGTSWEYQYPMRT